jgi:putative phosphoesterase
MEMILGLMADTHDRLPFLDKAVARLNKAKVELVLHAGDFVAPFIIKHLKPLKADLVGVFGNNDGEREGLKRKFAGLGYELRGRFAEMKADGLRIALLHGDQEELLKSLINSESHDVIVYGHTHETKKYRKGKTLIINPGEACGYLTGKATIALLNTQSLDTEILTLE